MHNDKKVTIEHENAIIGFDLTDNGYWMTLFNAGVNRGELREGMAYPPFQIALAGVPHGFSVAAGYTSITVTPLQMKMIDYEQCGDEQTFTYQHDEHKIKVILVMQLIPGAAVVRQTTTVVNEGDEPVIITHLSSLCMHGIATDGLLQLSDKRKLKVHYCRQAWMGEGQWREGDLEELGLYPVSKHPSASSIQFSNVGTWSTRRLLPMLVLEDMETNKSWFCQIETSANWQMEIGHRGVWGSDDASLFIHMDGASERNGGWRKILAPQESFTSVPAAIGCCEGGFTEAVKELTKYRRTFLKPKASWEGEFPVVFNDYMNTLWSNPTKEKLMPLIDAASVAGAEFFCIDAGWFGGDEYIWHRRLGDWTPNLQRFGEGGLQSVLDYIGSKGMKPGLWMEMEVCGPDSELVGLPDDRFIRRNGKRVGQGGDRTLVNFAHQDIRERMHYFIDQMYAMGVRFIKNDYNDEMSYGDDTLGDSAADGMLVHSLAFYSFIDEIRVRHADLIFENCGSGAMREDYGMMAHSHLVSTSDQENYSANPSIIGGTLAGILPEQAGIWAYPYPLLFADRDLPEKLFTDDYRKAMMDGEQTIFNMINGFCGNLYLSGHLEAADEQNMALVKEGVALYKEERKHIHNGFPIWPLGFTRLNDRSGWASIGIASESNSRILLAVWRLASPDAYQVLPLNKWMGTDAVVRQIYPSHNYNTAFYYNVDRGSLTVHFPKPFQARYFEIVRRR